MVYCKQCLEKQREIDELKEKVASLQAKLRYQEAARGGAVTTIDLSRLPLASHPVHISFDPSVFSTVGGKNLTGRHIS